MGEDNSDGGVVVSSSRQADIDESVGYGRGRISLAHQLLEFLIHKVLPDTVRADHQTVSGLKTLMIQVDFDVGVRTHGPIYNRTLRRVSRLFFGQLTHFDKATDQRVVGGQAAQRPLSPVVGPSLADMCVSDLVRLEKAGGDGTSHAAAIHFSFGVLEDGPVGFFEGTF